jgi:hypothetical protein
MSKRLLDSQASLLAHLTSHEGIFGTLDSSAMDPALAGLDPRLLRMEARFSFEKRIEKIAGVLPRTFELLGANRQELVQAFAEACPPATISRLANAGQFHAFLDERCRREPRLPAYLPDVAACELACARALTQGGEEEGTAPGPSSGRGAEIRRRRGVVLLRLSHDVRAVLETGHCEAVPVRWDIPLASLVAPSGDVQLIELPPALFDLLVALEDWTPLDGADISRDWSDLAGALAGAGLLEVRR